MKLTFNQWAQYPNTEEAKHEKRYSLLAKQCIKICKRGYSEKLKRILHLMGFTKLSEMREAPEKLKQFEGFFKHLNENPFIRVQDLDSIIYPHYPPAPPKCST